MELKHDWKILNEVLFPVESQDSFMSEADSRNALLVSRNSGAFDEAITSSGEHVLIEKGKALEGTDKTMLLSSADLDRLVQDAAGFGENYFQQIAFLREKIAGNEQKKNLVIAREHFLVSLFTTKFSRFLPKRFNVLVFIDQRSSLSITGAYTPNANYKALLLTFDNGKLDQFFEPDFSGIHEERLVDWIQQSTLISEYLENRYILPCYSLLMYRDAWERMLESDRSQTADPMRLFVRYCDDLRADIYPKNIYVKAYVFIQRLMLYFGKA